MKIKKIFRGGVCMGACKHNINEMQRNNSFFLFQPPPLFWGGGGGGVDQGCTPPLLKINICINKIISQRFYDTSYWYHKSCEGVGGLILEVGTFRKPFFGFSMHTPGLNICFICERTYLQLMIAFVPEH